MLAVVWTITSRANHRIDVALNLGFSRFCRRNRSRDATMQAHELSLRIRIMANAIDDHRQALHAVTLLNSAAKWEGLSFKPV